MDPLTSRSEGAGVGLNVDRKHRFRLPGVERGVGKTRLLHFFNPTGFDREEILEATIWDWPGNHERICAFDCCGNPLDIVATDLGNDCGHNRTDVLIRAKVPALGYTTVRISEAERKSFCFCALPPDPRVTYYHPLVMENNLVRIEFNEEDLSIKRYSDKKTGKELLGSGGGRFILYRERTVPRGGCGWVEGVHMDPKDLHAEGTAILKSPVQSNALRQSMTYELHYGSSTLQVMARLDADSPILELDVTAQWMEKADAVGSPKLSFRLHMTEEPDHFLSDSQIGTEIREPNNMHDWCSRNFYHAPATGATLLTDSKYGYRGYEDKMEVSLLRSSAKPDPYPELGERSFRIGITACSSASERLKALGQRFTIRDLPYASNRAHKGTLPLEDRFMKVEGAQVIAVKLAEDRSGLILRLAAAWDSDCVRVFAPRLTKAYFVDLAEQGEEECTVVNHTAAFPIAYGEVKTLKLEL